MAISPSSTQALAHHLDAGALWQPGVVQDECESGTAIVERGVVGHAVLGSRVHPGSNMLSFLAQQATLPPRVTGRRQTPVQRAGNTHL